MSHLAPPSMGGPGGMMRAPPQQHQQQQHAPPPNTVLLTHLPSFLHSVRAVREWIGPCGSSRTVLFVPPAANSETDILAEIMASVASADVTSTSTAMDTAASITALVTLSHADAAAKLMAAFRHFQQKQAKLATTTEDVGEAEQSNKMQAYLVPNHPDIPLKPVTMDPETAQVLGDKLWASYQTLSTTFQTTTAAAAAVDSTTTTTTATTTTTTSTVTAPTKIAAAVKASVGNGNDENDDNQDLFDDDDQQDPLTTPSVLAAVRDFRNRLEQQQGSKSIKRKEAVAQKLQEMLPVMAARMQEEATRPVQSSGQMLAAPPPPPGGPPPPPPMPTGNPPALPTPSAAENAPRGVSNLPAWITKDPTATAAVAAVAATATATEPPLKRPRLTPSLEGNTDQKFPALNPAVLYQVKEAIAAQCVRSVGEPVPTLVDFIYKHVTEQSTASVVLVEVQEVLEDEAAQFVQTLWDKVHELAAA